MRPILPILVVAALFLSGCAGGKSDPQSVPSDSPAGSQEPEPSEEPPTNEFDPKFHTHDYWAGRDKVPLYEGSIELGQDVPGETEIGAEGLLVGLREFDTKTDGEDGGLNAGKTDVVYQGTSHIEAKFTWTDANKIPGLRFSFKPANSYTYIDVGPVQSGTVYKINMGQHWADMPHQLSLSRWKFRLEAFNPATRDYPLHADYAQGSVRVEMWIFNGGGQYIDPPHPYFFTQGPHRYAGEINQTFTNCIFVNNTKVGGEQLPVQPQSLNCNNANHLKIPPPYIIPWETTSAIVEFWYNYSTAKEASPPVALGLKFHGSDDSQYRYPRPQTTSAGFARYEIGVSEIMTDSPYATFSDWMFGVYPIVQGQSDYGGELSGNLHIQITAVSDGQTASRGMGN